MASLRSSQGVSLLLVALLVCQAFIVPTLARTQVAEKKLLEAPQVLDRVEYPISSFLAVQFMSITHRNIFLQVSVTIATFHVLHAQRPYQELEI